MTLLIPDERNKFTELKYGFRVEKVGILSANDDLFDFVGECWVTLMFGEVTTVTDGGVSTVALNEKASSIPISTATTLGTATLGEMYFVTGQGDALLNGGLVPVVKVASTNADHATTVDDVAAHSGFLLSGGTGGLVIESTETGDDTGEITWVLYYFPLERGASITAAA